MHARPQTFHVVAIGCKVSQYEAQALGAYLQHQLGLRPVPRPDEADVVVLQTCTVTHQSDREARKLVRRLKRDGHARVIVTGCYAQRAPAELQEAGADLVLGHGVRHRTWHIRRFLFEEDLPPPDLPEWAEAFGPPALREDRTRAYLKVHDGCDVFCSFCIIPHVRGPARSLPPDEVLHRVEALVEQGIREIILTGVNLAGYGRDLGLTDGLLRLCERLDGVTADVQFRLSSLGAYDLDERLFELVCASSRFAPHFHLPLQSASDRVLQDMRRPYRLRDYDRIVRFIADRGDHICIGTDVIVGFPTESNTDFEATYRYIEESPISYVHVFSYSPRPGTLSASLWRDLDPRVVEDRSHRLRTLSAQKREQFYRRQVGRWLKALTLHRSRDGRSLRAITANYIEFDLDDPDGRWSENAWIFVRLGAYELGRWVVADVRPCPLMNGLLKAPESSPSPGQEPGSGLSF
ncbi:MAG: MiaB/RimO family radical SAM methylthiotransferase [Acidobacteriota bacterium]|nr:MiaB/RimO family radical SAM methylthiotransferase [Acidobacteriota bacterium]